jgi:hypothetical protein
VCVRAGAGEYYYINGKYRHPITSAKVLESWSFPFIVDTTEEFLKEYSRTSRLGFRDGTLIHDIGSGKLYFISKRLRRQVKSPEFLAGMQLSPKDAILVSSEEANIHKDGEVLI